MTGHERVVVDTNALVSRLLLPRSTPGRAFSHAVRHGRILISEAALEELALNGEADLIVSGDRNLLELDPFQGIRILNPAGRLPRLPRHRQPLRAACPRELRRTACAARVCKPLSGYITSSVAERIPTAEAWRHLAGGYSRERE